TGDRGLLQRGSNQRATFEQPREVAHQSSFGRDIGLANHATIFVGLLAQEGRKCSATFPAGLDPLRKELTADLGTAHGAGEPVCTLVEASLWRGFRRKHAIPEVEV